jgi:hypothetical protein
MAMDPKLDSLRLPPSELCWWCGDVATTEEHRFKRSTLRRLAQSPEGDIDPHNIFKKSSDFEGTLHSINKGSQVRWTKNLCANCNNARSQPFDLAYESFDSYVVDHFNEMMQWKRLDWSSMYGKEHKENSRNLARYFAKQMGCMLATQQLPVPQELIDFLNGAKGCPATCFRIFIDPAIGDVHNELRKDGIEDGLSTFVGLLKAMAYETGGQFSGFTYGYRIGYIRVSGEWFEGTNRSSWFKRRSVDLLQNND